MNTIDALERVFLFETLDTPQRRLVSECAGVISFEKGEHLYHEGDEALAFFAVLQGQCKVYRLTSGGEEFIVHIQQEGDVIAEAAMFDVRTYPASCVAMADSAVLRIDSRCFIALLLSEPKLSLQILHAYSRRLRSFVAALEELSLRDVKARLANYLLRNADDSAGVLFCPMSFSKKELATLLGTIPETLSRTLREFKSRGLVEERRNGFLIPEAHALRAYCPD
jgi:CRP/FNR family transcriptional regulator